MNNYISIDQVDNEIGVIRSFCNSYIDKLEAITDLVDSVSAENANINAYNNCEIDGSRREVSVILGIPEPRKNVKDVVVVPSNNIDSYCSIISSEIEEMVGRFNNILELLDSMDESMEVIAVYLFKIKNAFSNGWESMNSFERLLEAKALMEKDAKNGYEMLHNTPVLEDWDSMESEYKSRFLEATDWMIYKGKFLRFFNEYGVYTVFPLAELRSGEYIEYPADEIDWRSEHVSNCFGHIMEKTATFTDLHKQVLFNSLDFLLLEDNFDNDEKNVTGWAKGGWVDYDYGKIQLNLSQYLMYRRIDYIVESTNPSINSEISLADVLDTYVHETGHIFDNANGIVSINDFKTFSSLKDFSEFYDVVYSLKESDIGIRPYAFTNNGEFFAEFVGEYYGNNNSNFNFSSIDLMDLEVDLNGNTVNAYEIMDNILNKGRMY